MKTRNKNKTFLRKESITISFTVGAQTIEEKIDVSVYLTEWEEYGTSSTGRTGYTPRKALSFDYGLASFEVGTNTTVEDMRDVITVGVATRKYNCYYNSHLKKFFRSPKLV